MKVATQVDDSAIVEAFLHLPNDADPLLIRVTQELRKKDAAQPFIKRLMVHAGMPRWDYSELKLPSGSQPYGRVVINTTGSQQKILSEQNANDTTVLIPFVHEGVKRVNSFLAVHLADSMQTGLFQGKNFASFGYAENGEKPTAKAVAMRCMLFDHKIFKHNTFRVTYSTISSPLDYNHPVSGNREFGIFANPNNNGYTFYTMGVDRTTDWTFGLFNSFSWGFESADALWSNVQQKMVQYINNNGGQAISYTPVTARPKWNHVQRYLRGEISFTLLKKLLGC